MPYVQKGVWPFMFVVILLHYLLQVNQICNKMDFPNPFQGWRSKIFAALPRIPDLVRKLWQKGAKLIQGKLAESLPKYMLETRTVDDDLAEWVRQLRKDHGLTQEEFAEKVGVDPRTIQRWESREA